MQTAIKNLNPVVACLIVLFMPALVMGESLLEQVPGHLLEKPGMECRSDYLFVSAFAQAGHYRPDKAHDTAGKLSLHRAVYIAQLALADINLARNKHTEHREVLGFETKNSAPRLTLSGIVVLRQWEQAQGQMTLIAVPLHPLNMTCQGIRLQGSTFPVHAGRARPDCPLSGQHTKKRVY